MSSAKDMFNHVHIAILFLVIHEAGLAFVAHSQGQTGFISLDCGLPENSTYTEATTEITYISDAGFINGGESQSVAPEYRINIQQQVTTVRSFPQGIRNCYTTNTNKGTKYLIRATFFYGNYDGKNATPEFDLFLGTSFWETVKFEDASIAAIKEVIHFSVRDRVRVCLADTGSGTPFISALELRPLKNTTYVTQSDDESLRLLFRMDFGSSTNNSYRYPYDVYDRIWIAYSNRDWAELATSETVDPRFHIDFQPPNVVMNNAMKPANESGPLLLELESADINTGYYVYMHFAEIQRLNANESRAFNINVNGRNLFGPLVLNYLTSTTIYTPSAISGELNYAFTLDKLENSTLPPIVNAIEIFARVHFTLLETDENDDLPTSGIRAIQICQHIKSVYGVKRNWDGDPCLPVNYSWTGLKCSVDGSNPSRITSLDLSSSGLTGEISTYIGNLDMLESLDLSNNNLTGSVPDFLPVLQNLKVLNLRQNNLAGKVPAELIRRSDQGSLSLSIEENQDLCSSPPCEKKKKKKSSVVVPIASSVGGSLIVLALAAIIFIGLKKKKKQALSKTESKTEMDWLDTKKRQFSYSEMVKITNNFERVLGRGGFGTVYHGVLPDGAEVAVKVIHPPAMDTGSRIQSQEHERRKKVEAERHYQLFQAEVKLLLTVYHGKLTSLVGYCNQGTNRALIYEYMANGDLESHLLGNQGGVLSWETRLHIAIDSAQGLDYLHSGFKPPIIHRDIKTANILITQNFGAKLADFGLSKFFLTDDGTHVSTMHIAGTPGYLDPDLASNGLLNEKSDVYSFGVVLLQIITGRPVIRADHQDEKTHLSQWVRLMLENGNINNVVDPKLRGDFEINSAWKAVELAMSCASLTASTRPNMSRVVIELRECLALELARRNNSIATDSTYSKSDSLNLNMISEFRPLAR